MAGDEPYKLDKSQVVTTSRKLWSEIVDNLDPEPEDKTAYQFSNGRRMTTGGAIYE